MRYSLEQSYNKELYKQWVYYMWMWMFIYLFNGLYVCEILDLHRSVWGVARSGVKQAEAWKGKEIGAGDWLKGRNCGGPVSLLYVTQTVNM